MMVAAPARGTGQARAALDRTVFLSNAVPKSGSTLLFCLQESFLCGLVGRKGQSLDHFAAAGVTKDGYVQRPQDPAFLAAIAAPDLTGGPYVFKTHALFNGALRAAFLAQNNLHASMAIRDPAEVFFSARDNFRKTGEFPEFAQPEAGIGMIAGHFARMLDTVEETGRIKPIPVVRYETLVADPFEALMHSLPPALMRLILRDLAEARVDLARAQMRSAHRRNLGLARRPEARDGLDEFAAIAWRLAATRARFGYGGDPV